MNILHYQIVKQSNGKFAVWDSENQCFEYTNHASVEELKELMADKVDRILSESIIYFAQDDTYFKECVGTYAYNNGIGEDTPQKKAIENLAELGVSVEDI